MLFRSELFERSLNFKWEIIIVYGPADHSRSAAFLEELHRKISAASLPVVVGGDFNLLRVAEDKSNDNVCFARMQLFNDFIADLALREIDRIGARFTWTNRQASPTQSVLDRVLVSPEWDLRCSLASLRAITRIGSDHVPLLLSSADERPPIPLVSALRPSGSPSLDLPTPSARGGSRLGPTPTLGPPRLLTRGTSVRNVAGSL